MWSMIFGRKGDRVDDSAQNLPTAPPPAAIPFHETFAGWLDELDWLERYNSHILSAKAFAQLRVISDELREFVVFLQTYEIRPEEAYVLEGTVRRHIPEAIQLFSRLTVPEQEAGKEADVMLLEQCEHIEKSVRDLNKSMRARVLDDLDSQTMFVEQQFTQPF